MATKNRGTNLFKLRIKFYIFYNVMKGTRWHYVLHPLEKFTLGTGGCGGGGVGEG